MDHIREILMTAGGLIGGWIASVLGGWDSALTTLVIFMALDYATGLIVAGVFHKSQKSENGALESKAGWKGLCRKGMTLLVVLVASRLDLALGVTFVKDSVVIGFVINETISLLENAGLMGLEYPAAIKNALELLKKKNSTDEEDKNG